MKYSFKDRPYLFLALIALFMLIVSICITAMYDWSIYGIIAIIISGLGFLVLLFSFIYDLLTFNKEKNKNSKKEDKNDK